MRSAEAAGVARCGVRVLGTLPFLPRAWGTRTWAPLYSSIPNTALSAGTENRAGDRLQSQRGKLFGVLPERLIPALRK